MLLEKALAKLQGNYDLLTSGSINDAMFILTGAPSFFYANSTKTAAAIYADINSWQVAGHWMGATNTVSTNNNLVASHAYTILGAYTVTNGTTSVQLIKLRNPWGYGEWSGAYGDKDVFWTNNPTASAAVGF